MRRRLAILAAAILAGNTFALDAIPDAVAGPAAPSPAIVAAGIDFAAVLKAAAEQIKADPLIVVAVAPDGTMTVSARTEAFRRTSWITRNGPKIGWGGGTAALLLTLDRVYVNNARRPYGREKDWMTGDPVHAAEAEDPKPDVPQVQITIDNGNNDGNIHNEVTVGGQSAGGDAEQNHGSGEGNSVGN